MVIKRQKQKGKRCSDTALEYLWEIFESKRINIILIRLKLVEILKFYGVFLRFNIKKPLKNYAMFFPSEKKLQKLSEKHKLNEILSGFELVIFKLETFVLRNIERKFDGFNIGFFKVGFFKLKLFSLKVIKSKVKSDCS